MRTGTAWLWCGCVLALAMAGAGLCPWLLAQSAPAAQESAPAEGCHHSTPQPSTPAPICCTVAHHQGSMPEAHASVPAVVVARAPLAAWEPSRAMAGAQPTVPANSGSPPGLIILRI